MQSYNHKEVTNIYGHMHHVWLGFHCATENCHGPLMTNYKFKTISIGNTSHVGREITDNLKAVRHSYKIHH